MTFPACDNSTIVMQPSNGSFCDPAARVATQFATILKRSADTPLPMGTDQIDVLCGQPLAKLVAVGCFVINDTLQLSIFQNQFLKQWLNQNDFIAIGRFGIDSDGDSVRIDTNLHLCSFPTTRWANALPPF